ncbi:DUF4421 domain-containing protein [Pseudoflavitalea sp. G-6-1-2]|uniref:DUF4421 domain-containing protein n=1 Tax=Pseudoflavitalea sp. G-6-1-2 TaxID=2728841 RepID=UPI00146CB416|nr:DUF4421 domain-containing protein [Pseudoflavitalea sp. G-6-1-2]NML20173.1 DUF4421 domain-containing protein [Pseudoflavitalea sp. G-6-1-2]
MKKNWLMIVMLAGCCHASAQQSKDHDTDYYESYPDLVTARTYFSQKFTNLIIKGSRREEDLKYRPNTTLNYGIGGTYGWFTLNLAYGFSFLNRGNSSKGKTRYLDLQSHVYTRKMSIDLFGQFYKGFYLDPQGTATDKDKYYKRPDIKVRHMGAAVYYIVDWDRLSMRAAMLQTEWQKKSAGSLLVGGEVYYGYSKGDSALLPGLLDNYYSQDGVTKIRYFDIGPGIGYAYTYVHKEHFFAMGGITGSLPINFMKEIRDSKSDRKTTISPDLMLRIGVGYSNENFNISATFVNNMFTTKGNSGKYQVNTGNMRLNAAWRFDPGPSAKRTLKFFRSKV